MSTRPTSRTAWTQQALRDALRDAVSADASSPPANAWIIELREHDLRGAEREVESWLPALEAEALALVTEAARPMPGVVTVEVAGTSHLHRGQVRVRGEARSGSPSPAPVARGVPGSPRLELPAGGTAAPGSMAADGLVREVGLPAGRSVLGSAADVDIRLDVAEVVAHHAELQVAPDGTSVMLRDLGTGVGTLVDGVRRDTASLYDGARLQLGEATLVLRVDAVADRGRQGGGPEAGGRSEQDLAADPERSADRTSGSPLGVGPFMDGVRHTPTPLWIAVLLIILGAVLVGLAVALLDGPRVAAVACGIAGLVIGATGCVLAWRHRIFQDVT